MGFHSTGQGTDREMMQLYYMAGASSLAAHIVLEWVQASYQLVEMTPETLRSAGFLGLNAMGKVPVLTHGGFTLSESVAILCYLVDLNPASGLLGGDTRSRAEAMRWLAFLNTEVHPAFRPLLARQEPDEADAPIGRHATAARRLVREHLARLDRQLESRDWIAGARSVADPYLFVMFRWAVAMDVDLDGLRYLTAFARRMYGDAGTRAALHAEEGLAP